MPYSPLYAPERRVEIAFLLFDVYTTYVYHLFKAIGCVCHKQGMAIPWCSG